MRFDQHRDKIIYGGAECRQTRVGLNYIKDHYDKFVIHTYCRKADNGIAPISLSLKQINDFIRFCQHSRCNICPMRSICEDGFLTTLERVLEKININIGEIKMSGTKANDIHLLIAMLEDNHLHFNIYLAVMDFIKKILIAEGDINNDEELETITFGDINLSKEQYAKYKNVIDTISNDYFPFYANTALDDEEPTPNVFRLESTKIYTPLKDGQGVDENDYVVNVHMEWDDIDKIPEECCV